MLENFTRLHEMDIVLLQKITQFTTPFASYDIHYNIGNTLRGTTFIIRNTLMVTNISGIPSGRAIAASFDGIHILNIYAPSGTSKRRAIELFFGNDLPYLIDMVSLELLLSWEFNCVLSAGESTGHSNYSRSLSALMHGYS
jgi:hypothetical protein